MVVSIDSAVVVDWCEEAVVAWLGVVGGSVSGVVVSGGVVGVAVGSGVVGGVMEGVVVTTASVVMATSVVGRVVVEGVEVVTGFVSTSLTVRGADVGSVNLCLDGQRRGEENERINEINSN